MNTFSKLWGIKTPAGSKGENRKNRSQSWLLMNRKNLEEQALKLWPAGMSMRSW